MIGDGLITPINQQDKLPFSLFLITSRANYINEIKKVQGIIVDIFDRKHLNSRSQENHCCTLDPSPSPGE